MRWTGRLIAAVTGALVLPAVFCAPAGAVSWSAGYAQFGKVPVGDKGPVKTITVRANQFCQPVSSFQFDCTYDQLDIAVSGPFVITADTCGAPTFSRPACTVNVRFKPTERGKQLGFLRIERPFGGPVEGVPLVGKGCGERRKPECPSGGEARSAAGWSSAEDPLRFGKATLGETSGSELVTVRLDHYCRQVSDPAAPGGMVVECEYEGLETGLTGPFEVVREDCVTPPVRRPECTIELRYRPTRRGKQQGNLVLSAHLGGSIPLAGRGCAESAGRLRCGRKG